MQCTVHSTSSARAIAIKQPVVQVLTPRRLHQCSLLLYRHRDVRAGAFDAFRHFVSKYTKRDSQDELPDFEEGTELVRIDTESAGGLGGTSEDVFGPLAVLVIGFMQPEYEAFRAMMNDIEADMVKVVSCSKGMLEGTLQQALETEYPRYEQPPLAQRRAIILSGMYGSEVVAFIASYREAGLPPCVFGAAVPNNWQRRVRELVNSMWKDQAAMVAREQPQL